MTDEAKQWIAVTVLVFEADRVLSMQRAATAEAGAGIWEAISGRVLAGEDPLDAARRETEEESGLQVELDPRPVDTYAATRLGEPMTVLVYAATYLGGEVVLSAEHDAYRWCSLDELRAIGVPVRLVRAAERAWPGVVRRP